MIDKFIDLVNSKVGCAYVWGGQNDEVLTKEKLDQLIKTFGQQHYISNSFDARKWIGKKGYFDCSGLVCFCLQSFGMIPKGTDYTAATLYRQLCTPIDKAELKQGDLCFNNTSNGIVHVGVYMGNGRVTHARGTFYGVVNTQLFSSFNTFGRLKCFKDELTFEEALKIVTTKAKTPYEFWLKKKNIDPSFSALIVKIALAMTK